MSLHASMYWRVKSVKCDLTTTTSTSSHDPIMHGIQSAGDGTVVAIKTEGEMEQQKSEQRTSALSCLLFFVGRLKAYI